MSPTTRRVAVPALLLFTLLASLEHVAEAGRGFERRSQVRRSSSRPVRSCQSGGWSDAPRARRTGGGDEGRRKRGMMVRLGVMLVGCFGLLAVLQNDPGTLQHRIGVMTAISAATLTAIFTIRSWTGKHTDTQVPDR